MAKESPETNLRLGRPNWRNPRKGSYTDKVKEGERSFVAYLKDRKVQRKADEYESLI